MSANIQSRYKFNGRRVQGGFGDVVFCEDIHLSRKVAIKFLQNAVDIRRLWDELNALLSMRSKHVVQLYDIINREDEAVGIIEEYIDGEELVPVTSSPFNTLHYLKIIWQIASGIADIHASGIIHRDIKPNNMKLDREGIVKIFDFGLARNTGKEAATQGFVGTHGYAAPELYSYSQVSFTNAVDVYAFGAVAYYLACNDLPGAMKRVPPGQIEKNIFSKINISEELSLLLSSCVAYDADKRPKIRVVRDELSNYLLHNKHQALIVHNGKSLTLNSENKKVTLKVQEIGGIEIVYDGFAFVGKKPFGEVYINNELIQSNIEINGSCVIAIGSARRHNSERAFITFDVSNPEVVL
jgi:serine/threonine-protein kinase